MHTITATDRSKERAAAARQGYRFLLTTYIAGKPSRTFYQTAAIYNEEAHNAGNTLAADESGEFNENGDFTHAN